jgi:putative GTP pyrophosphokinase
VDGFTAEVVAREPSISRGKFNRYLVATIVQVRRYRAHFLESGKGDRFNAFTVMRHALYTANPELFASMLTNVARVSYDAWRLVDAAGS